MYSTVRIIAHTETYDIFNPANIVNHNKGIGSGFFIDTYGYILTCYHVIRDSVKLYINIPMTGKKQYESDIISVYPDMDIAIIKIRDYQNTYYLEITDSDDVDMGDVTIALGYPLGESTIKTTKGIISGTKDHLLQTDTSINSGNSGGPLLNEEYKVIGINSSKVASSSVEGVGYSIPINIFTNLKQKFLNENKENKINIIHEPNLYCRIQSLEKETIILLCNKFIADNPDTEINGVLISGIYKNSPLIHADKPLEKYDILTEFDNHAIDTYGDVKVSWSIGKISIKDLIKRYPYDEKIQIKYLSLNKQKIITTNIVFNNKSYFGINEIYYPERVKYINFKNIIICQLTLNHLSDIINDFIGMNIINKSYMHNFILSENRERPRIIIGKVLPSSVYVNNKNINNCIGMIINRINGIVIHTLEEFNTICESSKLIVNGNIYINIEMLNREHITLCLTN
jgi:S1-C subfamily serine protease